MHIRLRSQHWAAILWGSTTIAIGVVVAVDVGAAEAIFWTLSLAGLWGVLALWFRRYRLRSSDPTTYSVRRWLNDVQGEGD